MASIFDSKGLMGLIFDSKGLNVLALPEVVSAGGGAIVSLTSSD
jgi:hypothetical protein